MGRVVSLKKLIQIRHNAGQDGQTVVFTNGCFDLIHRGHVEYLEKARSMGDVLMIGLNSDRSVRELKGPGRPLNREEDRARVLAALWMVDFVCLFDEDTPAELIQAVVPDVLVKGGDYRPDQVVGRETVEAAGGRVAVVQLAPGFSTRGLIEKIRQRFG